MASKSSGTESLMTYWAEGKGAAKWVGSSTPFTTLRRHLAKYVPANELDGLTANLYHRVFGVWPGNHGSKKTSKKSSAEQLADRLK